LDFVEIFVLALIQGFLEWIPVSSEAFLMIAMSIFRYPLLTSFEIAILLHLSTATAALIYYRHEFCDVFRKIVTFQAGNHALTRFLFWTVLFTGLSAVPISYILRNIFAQFEMDLLVASIILFAIIGFAMISTGIYMFVTNRRGGEKTARDLRFRDFFIIGVLQGLATIPGVSRSGITISTLLFLGVEKEESVRLSFLLSVPTIYLAVLFEIMTHPISFSINLITTQVLLTLFLTFLLAIIGLRLMINLAKKLAFHKFLLAFGSLMLLLNIIPLIKFLQ